MGNILHENFKHLLHVLAAKATEQNEVIYALRQNQTSWNLSRFYECDYIPCLSFVGSNINISIVININETTAFLHFIFRNIKQSWRRLESSKALLVNKWHPCVAPDIMRREERLK